MVIRRRHCLLRDKSETGDDDLSNREGVKPRISDEYVALTDYKGWSLTCGQAWRSRFGRANGTSECLFGVFELTKVALHAGRPALPRCADAESGDKMIGRVSFPVIGFAVARSLDVVPEHVGSSGSLWRLRAAKRLSPKEDPDEASP